jgi:hypothetical protein
VDAQEPVPERGCPAYAAFGVLGILSFFFHDNFLIATVIGASFMLFFMGVGHVLDIQKSRNISP